MSGFPGLVPSVMEFLPGPIRVEAAERHPEAIRILLAGRLEEYELKGLDIAARAFGMLLQIEDLNRRHPALVVLGAPPGTGDRLRERLTRDCGIPGADIRPVPYVAERSELAAEIRRSSVLVMPSRSEGYGLVALEALSAQVPILVSRESGIYEHLLRVSSVTAPNLGLTCRGDVDEVAAGWAAALRPLLIDRVAAFRSAVELARRFREASSWDAAAAALIRAALDGAGGQAQA
jgi:glycosyltransferase involved in cell wall biosynthesis